MLNRYIDYFMVPMVTSDKLKKIIKDGVRTDVAALRKLAIALRSKLLVFENQLSLK